MIAVDLHIHSGLSPCAENDMTPNNIINMAKIKGLDAIAITDHNSTKNLTSFMKVAQKHNIICIPGVEITTKEEVHILALFSNLTEAMKIQEVLDDRLPKIKNNINIFGNQYIYDENDNIIEEYSRLLINSINLGLMETIDEILRIGGVAIPAHIDRHSFSIISNLGFISPDLELQVVEISRHCNYGNLLKRHPYLVDYKCICNSDAHDLGSILERSSLINTVSRDISEILAELCKKS